MSIESYARIDPAIQHGVLVWSPGSIAAGASNARASLGTIPAPLVDSTLMAFVTSNYGYGAGAGSISLDIIRADTNAVISAPGGVLQTATAVTYMLSRAINIAMPAAGGALPISVQYTVNTTNSYFDLRLLWWLWPTNAGAGG